MQSILINHSHSVIHFVIFIILVLVILIHFVVIIFPVLVLIDLILVHMVIFIHTRFSVDSLHRNVSTVWIDSVVRVDVLLMSSAQNPPLHNIAKGNKKSVLGSAEI